MYVARGIFQLFMLMFKLNYFCQTLLPSFVSVKNINYTRHDLSNGAFHMVIRVCIYKLGKKRPLNLGKKGLRELNYCQTCGP